MKNAIIVHGMPDKEDDIVVESEQHWIPWLRTKLEEHGFFVATPEMSESRNPQYASWEQIFDGFDVTEESVLIGHSGGAGFILRWLSSHPEVKVAKVVLVAPWLDPLKNLGGEFFDFSIDPALVSRTAGIKIFLSRDDEDDVQESSRIILEALPQIKLRQFDNKGHFVIYQMGTDEFPELLAEVL